MIKINLKENKKFPNDSKLGIFYSIVDVYSNSNKPINDTEMVDILKEKYGLEVERRTIRRYREFIIDNFDINLTQEKKGFYVKKTPSALDNKINKLQEVINSNEDYCFDDEDSVICNISYDGEKYKCFPLEIINMNASPYLFCILYDECTYFINLININKIKLLKPFKEKIDPYSNYIPNEDLDHKLSIPDLINLEVISDDNYKMEADVTVKNSVHLIALTDIIKHRFGNYTVKKGKKYSFIHFEGERNKVVGFVFCNGIEFKEINKKLKEEIVDLYNLLKGRLI